MTNVESQAIKRLVCPACNARFDGGTFCSKDGTPLVEDENIGRSTNRVGQTLADRYKLLRLLGEGGMGQVYEAQHVNINKRFAIKMLRPEIVSNPEATQRFRQEAWSASSIGHENIIGIDDFATLPDGSVYLAMEFLDGQSLAERLKKGPPLDMAQALSAFMQICRGLGAAHDKGIIHRDMKPENVFIGDKQGRLVVKILDFGIAKVSGADGTSHLTRTGQIFGTPHYMSPEQALGKPLDNRSDIYATGVMLYETFTGRIPFEAESFMGILTKHIMTPPQRPCEIAPDVPEVIEHVILTAMSKDPDHRYQDMASFHDALWSAAGELAPELVTATPSQPMKAPSSQPMPVSGLSQTYPAAPLVGGKRPSGPMSAPGRVSRVMTPVSAASLPAAKGRISASAQAQTMQGAEAAVALADSSGLDPIVTTGSGTARTRPVTSDDLDAPPRSKAGLVVALVLLALGAGGGVWYWQTQRAPVVAPTPQPPTPQPTPQPTPPPAKAEAVLIESVPSRAKVLQDGKEIAETPHPFVLHSGEKVTVTLVKEGYVSQSVDLDVDKGKKVLIRLEKDKVEGPETKPVAAKPERKLTPKELRALQKAGKSAPAGTKGLPKPPPIPTTATPQPTTTPPPATTQPFQPLTPVKKPPKKDPYERLDEKKGSEIMNPY